MGRSIAAETETRVLQRESVNVVQLQFYRYRSSDAWATAYTEVGPGRTQSIEYHRDLFGLSNTVATTATTSLSAQEALKPTVAALSRTALFVARTVRFRNRTPTSRLLPHTDSMIARMARNQALTNFFLLTVILCPGPALAEAPKHKFMEAFSAAERARPFVQARSRTVPQNFLDGQWQGTIAASDGKTYFGLSCHSEALNAQFFSYDPAADKMRHIIDVGAWCGETDSVGKVNTQGKIHSNIYEHEGKLYMSSTRSANPEFPYKGGHFLSYDLKTGECRDLGHFKDTKGGLMCMVHDPVYQRLYAISEGGQKLIYYDLKSGKITTVGMIEENAQHTRTLIADPEGIIYGSTWGGLIYRYDPKLDMTSGLITLLPKDPDAPPVPGPTAHPTLIAYDRSMESMKPTGGHGRRHWDTWGPMIWDSETRWWYGILQSQEYLFRFRPPNNRRSHHASVEGLASMSFRPPKQRMGNVSFGFGMKGRKLYFVSYPVWRSQAHLTSYEMGTGVVTDHGPIVLEGGRRISEMHALVLGSDGKLHGPAMVWSIDGKDPANDWGGASRASSYIHCRLVIIDPKKDFKHAADSRKWQGKSAK